MRARTGVDTIVKTSLANVIDFFLFQGFAGDRQVHGIPAPYLSEQWNV